MSDTIVVNQRTSAFDVDIGRGSPFGNPYTHMRARGDHRAAVIVANRDIAIARYHRWLTTDEEITGWPKPTLAQILSLAGKRLGCWCKPMSCHGDILVEMIREAQARVANTARPARPAPFLRWVGSKRWLAPTLAPWVRERLHSDGVYCEPFLGAGTVALALDMQVPRMYLGERCHALSGLWWWLQRDAGAVADCLARATWQNTADGYAAVVKAFNELDHFDEHDPTPSVMMLWLNHTCFNGVYRENRAGKYNVPWGKRKTIALPSRETLVAVGHHLQRTELRAGCDYAETLELAGLGPGSVVYADPPYDGTFTSYTSFGFGDKEQAELADNLRYLVSRGVAVATTNSDTPFIRGLYPTGAWNVQTVSEPRSVAARGSSRTRAPCLLITSP